MDPLIDRVAAYLILAAAISIGEASAQMPISKVSLMVVAGDAKEPTAGALYKVGSDSRSYMADVASDGSVSKPIACNVGDIFEAEAESALNRPLAPSRRTCGPTMVFSFKRTVLVSWNDKESSPIAFPHAGPAVFSNYSTIFAKMGQADAASAWSDAAIAAAVTEGLGDVKLEKYVVRDPSQGHRLVFSNEGIAALKEKQVALGLKPTGQLDSATQSAFAAMKTKATATQPNAVGPLRCVMKDGMLSKTVVCAPSASFKPDQASNPLLIGLDKKSTLANLPSMAF